MRRRFFGAVLVIAALFVAVGATLWIASESGEVVVLVTRDNEQTLHETRLWVIEDAGQLWLRAGVSSNAWLKRIEDSPDIALRRGGREGRYRAHPSSDPATVKRINELMGRKYGLADRLISLMRDGDNAVAVRLVADTSSAADE